MDLARILRPITKNMAERSYEELKLLDCSNIPKFSRIGTVCLDFFFFKYRLKTKTKRHISFYDAVSNRQIMDYIDAKIVQIKKKTLKSLSEQELLRLRYSVFQLYYGSVNQYKPTEAFSLYCKLQPKIGVLDFSAGWGGRCIAAMAYGVPYMGIDANTNLESSYNGLIKLCNPSTETKIVFAPSETVDFSKFKYDLVFTSPPYFMMEEYEKMPKYGSKSGFIEKFFRPVVRNAWKNLHSSGYMALNMPKEMYDAVKNDLPHVWKRFYLPVSTRHPTNAASGRAIGSVNSKERSETIYVWKKTEIIKNETKLTRKTTRKLTKKSYLD